MTKSDNLLAKIVPATGYVLIEPDEQAKKTDSGIYLPDNAASDKPQTGTVLAVGAALLTDGQKIESPAKKKDKVFYKKWGGNEVKIANKEYLFVKFEDVLAVYGG